ncbi:MAG: hypothetical protein M3162_02690 [Thermoproteota archaeon]|nr:hypothetical protein [Thermoproteota archaeon]
MNGKTRDEIAVENRISAGKVSETIKQWRAGIGIPEIEDLRKFAVSIKKTNISVGECAKGFRILQMLKNMGIEESNEGNFDEFSLFVEKIYTNCKRLGINPSIVPSWIKDLTEFLQPITNSNTNFHQQNNESIFPSQSLDSQEPFISLIAKHMSQIKKEVAKLEQDRQKIKQEIKLLTEQKQNESHNIETLIQEESDIIYYRDWFYELRDELWYRYSIRIEDVGKFAKVIKDFKNHHYNAYDIIKEYTSLLSVRGDAEILEQEVERLQKEKVLLYKSIDQGKAHLSLHKNTMNIYSELEAIGFGIKELKQLWSTILEISKANNIDSEEAVLKFLKYIEEQFDDYLGFEKKVNEKRNELAKINNDLSYSQFLLQQQPYIGPFLTQLLANGLNAEDIINLNQIAWRYGKEHSASIPNTNDNKVEEQNNIRSSYWRNFNQRLQLILDIDSELNNQQKKLEKISIEIANVSVQKQELFEQCQGATNYLIFMFDRIQYYSRMLRNIQDELDDKRKAFSRLGPLLIILVYVHESKKDDS